MTNWPHSLVSYNEISNAFPSNKVLKEIAGKELNEKEWMEEYDKLLGELFKMDFFRVVLDEGHAIRNHETKSLSLPSLAMATSQKLTSFTSRKGLHQPDQQISVDLDRHPSSQQH